MLVSTSSGFRVVSGDPLRVLVDRLAEQVLLDPSRGRQRRCAVRGMRFFTRRFPTRSIREYTSFADMRDVVTSWTSVERCASSVDALAGAPVLGDQVMLDNQAPQARTLHETAGGNKRKRGILEEQAPTTRMLRNRRVRRS